MHRYPRRPTTARLRNAAGPGNVCCARPVAGLRSPSLPLLQPSHLASRVLSLIPTPPLVWVCPTGAALLEPRRSLSVSSTPASVPSSPCLDTHGSARHRSQSVRRHPQSGFAARTDKQRFQQSPPQQPPPANLLVVAGIPSRLGHDTPTLQKSHQSSPPR